MTLHKASNVNVTSDKVKLPKNVAEAIKSLSTKWMPRGFLQLRNYDHPVHEEAVLIKEYFRLPESEDGFKSLTLALYIGYEVEQTPEEKLLYCYAETSSINGDFRGGYKAGIIGTLSILNIKVKGINA